MDQQHEELFEAISFFENILETLPGDPVSLEFLGGAYEQIGDRAKALEIWRRLAVAVLQSSDVEQARIVRPKLMGYLEDPEAATLTARLEALIRMGDEPVAEKKAVVVEEQKTLVSLQPAALRMAAAAAEMDISWLLHEKGFLNAQEYERLTMEITEGDAEFPDKPISALLSLHNINPGKAEEALLYLIKHSGLVPIRLDVFAISKEMVDTLPTVYIRIRGAFPFGIQKNSLMVALLNPEDRKMREEIEEMAQCPCSFFLAHPAYIESALETFPY